MQIKINAVAETRRAGFEYEPKELPDTKEPARYVRYDGDRWDHVQLNDARGFTVESPSLASVYPGAIARMDELGADTLEFASAPNDARILFYDACPKCKGAALRTVVVCPPSYVEEMTTTAGRVWNSTTVTPTPTRIPFRSVERTVWLWGRLRKPLAAIHEVAPNGGAGDLIWAPPPAEIDVPCPEELLPNDIAQDRYNAWAAIARRMFDSEYANKLLAEIDLSRISQAALKKHKLAFAEAAIPELVTRWQAAEQTRYAGLHEALCVQGYERHQAAPAKAIEMIGREHAETVFAGIVAGTIPL
jgi:hypothetical protein